MKNAIFIIALLTIIVDKCQPDEYDDEYPESKEENKQTFTTPGPERINVTYPEFNIPPEILVSAFKNIMEKVSSYKRGTYCPFQNKDDCGRENALTRAITTIITEETNGAESKQRKPIKKSTTSKKRFSIFSGRSFEPVKKNSLNLKLYMDFN